MADELVVAEQGRALLDADRLELGLRTDLAGALAVLVRSLDDGSIKGELRSFTPWAGQGDTMEMLVTLRLSAAMVAGELVRNEG